ncbi:hypothetical protein IWW45_004301 [Coemansia sp. RSA 485]|nr:hypothetical protein IWW45_004301 [Coemansia sp. RSA 485]
MTSGSSCKAMQLGPLLRPISAVGLRSPAKLPGTEEVVTDCSMTNWVPLFACTTRRNKSAERLPTFAPSLFVLLDEQSPTSLALSASGAPALQRLAKWQLWPLCKYGHGSQEAFDALLVSSTCLLNT